MLKLQAWVDGELSKREVRRLTAEIEGDPDAQALVAELKMTRGFLAGNEPPVTLPESREFYWSKIQREIERLERTGAPEPAVPWWVAVRRLLAPLSGVALVAFLSVISINLFYQPEDPARQLVETENLSEHVGSISYRSQAENMFVVYLYAKDAESGEAEVEPDAAPADDLLFQ
jgi:anti-sigma factor RsiW